MKKFITFIMICALVIAASGSITVKEWSYTMNGQQINYEIGEEVEWNGRIFRCTKWDAESMAVMVPPEANPDWWAEVQQ